MRLFSNILIILSVLFVSCGREDDNVVMPDADPVEVLQQAYEDGKVVSSIKTIKSEAGKAFAVRFAGGGSVIFPVEQGSVVPCLKISDLNFWLISADCGSTYAPLTFADGSKVMAGGRFNMDRCDERSGGNGCSVSVGVNVGGEYVVDVSDALSGKIKSRIVTGHACNKENVVRSIVVDKADAMIYIALNDGRVLDFRQELILPQCISVLSSEETLALGGTVCVDIQVTPSNAFVDLRDLSVCGSEHIYIYSVMRASDTFGNVVKDRYQVTLRDKGSSSLYSDDVRIVLSSEYADGQTVNLTSETIKITSTEAVSLPKVFIDTPGGAAIVSKTDWLEDCTIRIVNEDEVEELNASASVRGRGNSTWSYPKKPYAVKFDSKTEVLGMPKHKRWVLLANWMDRTLLRNDVAFEMGRRIMDWAPRGEFVELYMNGEHQGNYYLCEQIKVDANRVNVDKEEGYILEFDTYGPYDEINYFYTSLKGLPVTIKEPDEDLITSWDHPGFLYIQDYVNGVESLLTSGASWEQIQEQIDVVSFIDWWLIHELSTNWEPLHPKSSYMHKDKDGKLKAGPVWDFDWGTFMPGQYWLGNQEAIWYVELFGYEEFKLALKTRWNEVKDPLADIGNYIDLQAERLRQSDQVNFAKWPITTVVNGDESLTYDAAIKRMRQAFSHRMSVIDTPPC